MLVLVIRHQYQKRTDVASSAPLRQSDLTIASSLPGTESRLNVAPLSAGKLHAANRSSSNALSKATYLLKSRGASSSRNSCGGSDARLGSVGGALDIKPVTTDEIELQRYLDSLTGSLDSPNQKPEVSPTRANSSQYLKKASGTPNGHSKSLGGLHIEFAPVPTSILQHTSNDALQKIPASARRLSFGQNALSATGSADEDMDDSIGSDFKASIKPDIKLGASLVPTPASSALPLATLSTSQPGLSRPTSASSLRQRPESASRSGPGSGRSNTTLPNVTKQSDAGELESEECSSSDEKGESQTRMSYFATKREDSAAFQSLNTTATVTSGTKASAYMTESSTTVSKPQTTVLLPADDDLAESLVSEVAEDQVESADEGGQESEASDGKDTVEYEEDDIPTRYSCDPGLRTVDDLQVASEELDKDETDSATESKPDSVSEIAAPAASKLLGLRTLSDLYGDDESISSIHQAVARKVQVKAKIPPPESKRKPEQAKAPAPRPTMKRPNSDGRRFHACETGIQTDPVAEVPPKNLPYSTPYFCYPSPPPAWPISSCAGQGECSCSSTGCTKLLSLYQNASITAVNCLLAQHLKLMESVMLSKSHLTESFECYNASQHEQLKKTRKRYSYTTLEDTLAYIKEHRKPIITYEAALKQVMEEDIR
ncbi:hypothetical protein SeMB42_g06118 [Synchytrium endobioticum]|uniref:Uncharacterized protein n=1 Tax=Synchytrium endobioticum TaxID=286115 RepID=A0A507CMR0_9FUNG|nr:hypothetical protein SeMB42_g06118 [Synchytrium endobioticum]